MNEAERLAVRAGGVVRGVEPREHVDQDRLRDGRRDRPAAHERGEGLARDVLHDDPEPLRAPHGVERGHDVGVLDARRQLGLVEEHGQVLAIGDVRALALDGDDPGEALHAAEPAEVHRAHAPARDGWPKDVSLGRKSHIAGLNFIGGGGPPQAPARRDAGRRERASAPLSDLRGGRCGSPNETTAPRVR